MGHVALASAVCTIKVIQGFLSLYLSLYPPPPSHGCTTWSNNVSLSLSLSLCIPPPLSLSLSLRYNITHDGNLGLTVVVGVSLTWFWMCPRAKRGVQADAIWQFGAA